jgi:toxin-antitoxin system PIN domain toxin
MTVLLDSSLLMAAAFEDHVHSGAADRWLEELEEQYATCPITQGALIRLALQTERTVADALDLLEQITSSDRHEFWPDEVAYAEVQFDGVIGHRQVTDAYLAQLARSRKGRVATLDRGFAALHKDVADLVPTS